MKFTLLRGLTAALTISGTALAQQTIGPFFLRLQSNDSYINGRYLGAYHSGAAQATLGIDQKTRPPADARSSYIYTLNYTGEGDYRRGGLTWVLDAGHGIPAVLPLGLVYGLGTNVAGTTLDVLQPRPQPVERYVVIYVDLLTSTDDGSYHLVRSSCECWF